MGKNGGKRPGAGRKPGTLNAETFKRLDLKKRWLARVAKVADKIFDAHLDSALGHFKEVKTPDGGVKVYKTSPNSGDLQWLQEHIWGKANQPLDLTSQGEKITGINYIIPHGDKPQAES